jgi:hypothetical protein
VLAGSKSDFQLYFGQVNLLSTCVRYRHWIVVQRGAELIAVFNAMVQHMAQTVSDRQLMDVSWPPVEFCDTHTG